MIKVKPFPLHLLTVYGSPRLPPLLPPSPRPKRGSWVKALHRRLELTKKKRKIRRRRRGKRGGRKKKQRGHWVEAPWAKKRKKIRRRRPAAKSDRWQGHT